jgi:hypothetical protein
VAVLVPAVVAASERTLKGIDPRAVAAVTLEEAGGPR